MLMIDNLPNDLMIKYEDLKPSILKTLQEYAAVPKEKYFYEFCYCVCTPQSSARNAFLVQQKLEAMDFWNNDFDPVEVLNDKSHYIRFHNQKAKRLTAAKAFMNDLIDVLGSDRSDAMKRNWINDNFSGLGLKESSHFLRNIGYRNLAIIDRHLLKHLLNCEIIDQIPKTITPKMYFQIEQDFLAFSEKIGISMDELDILFWSNETGIILK